MGRRTDTVWGCYYTDNHQFTTSLKPAFGYIDSIVGTESGIEINGWTMAPDAPTTALGYQVIVDGVVINPPYGYANTNRSDVGSAFPGYGDWHGMYAEVPASLAVGYHVVCIQGQSGGVYSQLGCGTI